MPSWSFNAVLDQYWDGPIPIGDLEILDQKVALPNIRGVMPKFGPILGWGDLGWVEFNFEQIYKYINNVLDMEIFGPIFFITSFE